MDINIEKERKAAELKFNEGAAKLQELSDTTGYREFISIIQEVQQKSLELLAASSDMKEIKYGQAMYRLTEILIGGISAVTQAVETDDEPTEKPTKK